MTKCIIDVILKLYPNHFYCIRKGDAYNEEFYLEELKMKGTVYDINENKRIYTFMHTDEKQEIEYNPRSMEKLYKDILEKSVTDVDKEENANELEKCEENFDDNLFFSTSLNECEISRDDQPSKRMARVICGPLPKKENNSEEESSGINEEKKEKKKEKKEKKKKKKMKDKKNIIDPLYFNEKIKENYNEEMMILLPENEKNID